MAAHTTSSNVYVACVPHVPLLEIQSTQKEASAEFWRAYDARVEEFEAFNPDLIIQFGSDHYSNVRLDLMPQFLVGFRAEAIGDCGGLPGKLDVPMELSIELANSLVDDDFDVATSYAMKVDHGFSNCLNFFLRGEIAGKPVIPIFINAMAEPRPKMKRVRLFGEAVGAWAAKQGKRVAFLGSGGLSHETVSIFPQYRNAPNDLVRNFIVHGGQDDGISDHKWHDDIEKMMISASAKLIDGLRIKSVSREWDERFLKTLSSDDLSQFDSWSDADIVREGGQGGSEIRMWLAAVAAARAAGLGGAVAVDYYSDDTTIAVGAGVVHAPA